MIPSIFLYTNILLSIILSIVVGYKRNIGDNWSLFFGVTLSVFFQIAITMTSSLKKDKVPRIHNPLGIFVCMIGIIGIVIFFYKCYNYSVNYSVLAISTGITGWGIYLTFPNFLKSVNE